MRVQILKSGVKNAKIKRKAQTQSRKIFTAAVFLRRNILTPDETARIRSVRSKLFDLYYSSLNPQQRKALYQVNGPLLVLAGAGSGKTTVLVKRIAHIVSFGDAFLSARTPELTKEEIELVETVAGTARPEDKKLVSSILTQFAVDPCEPDRVLAITFTNKAAGEIRSRLEAELGERASQIWAGTFHSVCVRILRRHADLLGYDRDFVIYDTDDQKKLVKDCVKKLSLDDEVFTPKKIVRIISNCKNELGGWEQLEAKAGGDFEKEKTAEIFREYQRALREANALDFDDIISLTVELFKRFPDVLEIYKRKFLYVLVDEYQDTNRAQCLLMSMIASGHGNVMVVGDDDQSIYRFRGAVIDNILSFDRAYPDAVVIRLEQNYRSTSTILDAANAVIGNNSRRKGKRLWCGAGKGDKIVIRRCEDQEAEAIFIADTVNSLVASGKASYRDFAVLYRVNAVSNALETVLSKAGVPHRLLGGLRFYDRAEIRDMIAYLCVVNNPSDTVHLKRIVNVPRRGIGETTVDRVLSLSESLARSPIEIMASAAEFPELKKSAGALGRFAAMINGLRETARDEKTRLSDLFRALIDASGYIEMLDKSGGDEDDRKDNLEELISSAISFEKKNPGGRLCDFLEEAALVSDVDDYDQSADSVVLMTVHSAKGLEFPYVFIAAMEEKVFPSSMVNEDDDEELEEERRLCYVALTRAKKRLFITLTQRRTLYGRTNFSYPSRFIDEIPPRLCESNLGGLTPGLGERDLYRSEGARYSEALPHYGSGIGAYGRMPLHDRELMRSSPASGGFPSGMKATPYPAAPKKPEPLVKEVFGEGDRVRHAMFGEGTVLSVKKVAADYCYEIAFDTKGAKKIMASFAKLKKA